MQSNQSTEKLTITPQEKKLILLCREIEYGEVSIVVKKAQPVMAQEVRKNIKLDS